MIFRFFDALIDLPDDTAEETLDALSGLAEQYRAINRTLYSMQIPFGLCVEKKEWWK